jgi:hypothetical protein
MPNDRYSAEQVKTLAQINVNKLPKVPATSQIDDYGGEAYDDVYQDDYEAEPVPRATKSDNYGSDAAGLSKGTSFVMNSSGDIPADYGRKRRRGGLRRRRRRQGARRRLDEALRPAPAARRHHGGSGSGGGLLGGLGKMLKKKESYPKGEMIWLESSVKLPGSSSGYGGSSSSSSSGYRRNDKKRRAYDSSSSGGTYYIPKPKGGFKCSIGRTEKGDDAALITLGSIGIPLAIAGAIFGGSLGGNQLSAIATAIANGITGIINAIGGIGGGKKRSDGDASEERGTKRFPPALALMSPLMWPAIIRNVFNIHAGKSHKGFGRSLSDAFSVIMWKLATSGVGLGLGRKECSPVRKARGEGLVSPACP